MLAIKADYQDGKIIFLENIPEKIKKARLTIVVEPEGETSKDIGSPAVYIDSESAFELIGINEFFNENDDKIDWEDYFGIK